MGKVNYLTRTQYATHRGVSPVAVHKAIEADRISTILVDGKKMIDPVVADIQWEQNSRARVTVGASPTKPIVALASLAAPAGSAVDDQGPTAPTAAAAAQIPLEAGAIGAQAAAPVPELLTVDGYAQFRARREQAEAELAEMRAAEQRGVMLLREDVDRAMFEVAREFRDGLTGCARRISAEVASISTAEGCEIVLEREHRILLEMLTLTFREKLGAPPVGAAAADAARQLPFRDHAVTAPVMQPSPAVDQDSARAAA